MLSKPYGLNSSCLNSLSEMAHLFKRMYLEDITDIEKQFTPGELTTPITIELMKRKIDKLQRQKEIPISTTKTNQLFSWWNYSNEAKQQIEQQQMWKLILEAFKIIHYKDSTVKCQDIYEQTLKLSYIDLHTRYSTIEKTFTFKNLIDYLIYMFISTEI